ncbi:unnamed protein product, partial [marine sediment metagenome]
MTEQMTTTLWAGNTSLFYAPAHNSIDGKSRQALPIPARKEQSLWTAVAIMVY